MIVNYYVNLIYLSKQFLKMKQFYLLVVIFITTTTFSQDDLNLSYYFSNNLNFNKSIPTPENVLGYRVGEWHTNHDKLVEYMRALAKSSDRISIEDRGKTFEGRPLILLTVTSPENHNNIDDIRENHFNLTEINKSEKLDTEKMPLVVYQGYSVHGNEPSGANASLLLAYYLAAAEGDEIEKLLKNTVILVDPCLNPDGLQRFAYWVNTNKSKHLNPDSNDREFREVWPGGRTNHYWFDMNRDWLAVQLPESKVRIETFHKWKPNILTDHHEHGTNSTYFFQPGVPSRVHPLTPKLNQELTKEIAQYHARALDKIGSFYYTEEGYDDFYYGKGSTYPDINGAVGILFEQASSRGHAQESVNGVLTFPFTIKNQLTTSLSTLKAANELRVKLLNYQRDFFRKNAIENSKNNIKAIVFGGDKNRTKTYELAKILERHRVEIHKVKQDFSVDGKNYSKEHSFIIPTDQKNSKIIKTIFEKRTKFTDSLFYDITAWTFPLAFNLNYSELKSKSQIGDQIENLKLMSGKVTAKSSFAYLMEWHEYYTPKLLYKLLQKGIRAKVGLKEFSLNGLNYDYGTILIPVQNQRLNEEEIYEFLRKLAVESKLTINGVNTGLTDGVDLGSPKFKAINTPNVAMMVGRGISSYDSGEIWHLFDQRYEIPITKLDTDYLRKVDLSRYTTIILPNIRSLKLEEGTIKKLKNWVSNGGVLIGYKNAVKWLSNNKLISLEYNSSKVEAKTVTFEQKRDFSGAQVIGGAIFETMLDRSHPINFGISSTNLPMFRRTKVFIKPDKRSYNNPIKYTNTPLLSGYISKPNLEALKNTVPFQIKKYGVGKVVVFTDNTNFRGFWYGTNKLLMNAVFFNKMM